MPELPEVETTRRGISPHVLGKKVTGVVIRESRLRWPVPKQLHKQLKGRKLQKVERRAKYLLFQFSNGTIILHLGMSGSLRVVAADTLPEIHDHLDICFGSECLRFRDPRRFGAVLWTENNPLHHARIIDLGPEPLSGEFSGEYLYQVAKGRNVSVKNLVMDGKVVVGVGNIYANESLFLAGIRPNRPCNRISKARYAMLVEKIKLVLEMAIRQGGTTLRDFKDASGKPGYFKQSLMVYGRGDEPCMNCGTRLKEIRIGQRSSVYCPKCQS